MWRKNCKRALKIQGEPFSECFSLSFSWNCAPWFWHKILSSHINKLPSFSTAAFRILCVVRSIKSSLFFILSDACDCMNFASCITNSWAAPSSTVIHQFKFPASLASVGYTLMSLQHTMTNCKWIIDNWRQRADEARARKWKSGWNEKCLLTIIIVACDEKSCLHLWQNCRWKLVNK